jgi:hypothetical protein
MDFCPLQSCCCLAWNSPLFSDLITQGCFCLGAPLFPRGLSSLPILRWQKERARVRSLYWKTLVCKFQPLLPLALGYIVTYPTSGEQWGEEAQEDKVTGLGVTCNLCPFQSQHGNEESLSKISNADRVGSDGRGYEKEQNRTKDIDFIIETIWRRIVLYEFWISQVC